MNKFFRELKGYLGENLKPIDESPVDESNFSREKLNKIANKKLKDDLESNVNSIKKNFPNEKESILNRSKKGFFNYTVHKHGYSDTSCDVITELYKNEFPSLKISSRSDYEFCDINLS